MKSLLANIIGAILGLWLSTLFVVGVSVRLLPSTSFFGIHLTALWEVYLLLGIILGLINFFVKPVLEALTLPLEVITLGLFWFLINMGMIWVLEYIFKEFRAPWFYPLLW